MTPGVSDYVAEKRALERTGDQMQSALSRIAEWVQAHQSEAPYEVEMAALEGQSAVEQWTEIRRAA